MIEILVVEDNNFFRKTLTDFINQSRELNCKNSFASCEEALKELKTKKSEPDVILLDIGLPGMSGIEGIPHFKRISPKSKIIMLTVQDDDDSIFNAICKGASGYLLKDLSSKKIIESIREVLNGGAPMNSTIAAKALRIFRKYLPERKEYNLSSREKEILKYLIDGLSKKQIAEEAFLSYHTIDFHVRNIYKKLEVHSGSSAVAKALKENLI